MSSPLEGIGSSAALDHEFPSPNSDSAADFSGALEPDLSLSVSGSRGETLGRCSLWWRNGPNLRGRTVGYIGEFTARDTGSAVRLLDRACKRLAAQGRMLAVGPVDGSTWLNYRCVVQTSTEPRFLLEPRNRPEWPKQFRAAGFEPLAYYRSSVQEDLSESHGRLIAADARLKDIGISIRAFDARRVEEELRRIHALSLNSFTRSLLFSPISADTFMARYRAMMQLIEPELVLLAEHGGRLVGYLFALPNAFELARGKRIETVILKTIAVLPGRRYAGLGHVLAMHGAERARALGYRRAIHALMHEGNGSANWSARLGRPIRRYALFARTLHRPDTRVSRSGSVAAIGHGGVSGRR